MKSTLPLLIFLFAFPRHLESQTPQPVDPNKADRLSSEKVAGEGVWVDPAIEQRLQRAGQMELVVWFDKQLLGDGKAYRRRAEEFSDWKRSDLRVAAQSTLQALSNESWNVAKPSLDALIEGNAIRNLRQHWIVNGISCSATAEGVEQLRDVPGVKKIFLVPRRGGGVAAGSNQPPAVYEPIDDGDFDPTRYKHPWYTRYLQADRVWKEFGIAGRGTLNVIHDFNFVFSDGVTRNLYRNPEETPGNGKDDDGNGLIDDYHGYNFDRDSADLTMARVPAGGFNPQAMHGYMCAAIICASGSPDCPYEFGLAPQANWAGVIGSQNLEAAIEWAVQHGADTYSMSFSIPNLGEYRSHWRKMLEHGSMCGVCFVSGAGNFAMSAQVPVQMRVPEDIPDVVFAAAGVQRNLSRTPFSSKGPVEWMTEHYQDGRVAKPEVCAFNMGLPVLMLDHSVQDAGLNGNSFAGPMFCGSIALMLSADPDLLPWELKQIITSTATDVAAPGVDDETGHGLINCYRAVKETLRRKALRDGQDASLYEPRPGDTLDVAAVQERLRVTNVKVVRLQPQSQAAKKGIQAGDIIVSYYEQPIATREDLMAAKQKADADQVESIPVTIQRDGELIELELEPAPLGFVPVVVYREATFE